MKSLRLFSFSCAVLIASAAFCSAQSVVPNRTIRSHTIIALADVKLSAASAPGSYALIDDVVGKESRVALYPGRPIRVSEIGPPAIIERNQIISLKFHLNGLSITADGRALDRAGLGDRLRVMNLSSRTTVIGTAVASGIVEVSK